MPRSLLLLAILWVLLPGGPAAAQSAGDTNCDGAVDFADLDSFTQSLFVGPPADGCAVGDVNGDTVAAAADVLGIVRAMHRARPEGPLVTYFGLSSAGSSLLSPYGYIGTTPVFFRNAGSGFRIVVEAGLGTNSVPPGETTLAVDALDPNKRPDLQVVCDRDLGDGNDVICDGGVPAVAPPHFDSRARTSAAINDLGCHFSAFTSAAFGCTLNSFGNPSFVDSRTRLQYCLLVNRALEFPQGSTLCSVQVRDRGGNLGPQTQFIVEVGSGPPPATFTPTVLATATATRAPATATATLSPTPPPSSTPTRIVTVPRSPTPTVTRPAATPTTPPATATSATTPSTAATSTRTRTPTPTATRSLTPTPPRSPSRSSTPTLTPTVTRTFTPAPGQGPVITFFGMARADDLQIQPVGVTNDGIPIYNPPVPVGIRLVIEAQPGPSGEQPGTSTFSGDPSFPPDLQILSSRPLGNGSSEVCDREGAGAGGVPGVNPPVFSNDEATLAAISDLACRFLDGSGAQMGRVRADDSCVATAGGIFRFVSSTSTIQYCAQVDRFFCFPPGDTLLTARVRDELFNTGAPARIVVRNTQSAIVCP